MADDVETYKNGKLTRFHELNHQVEDELNAVDEGPQLVYSACQLTASARGRTFVVGTFECDECANSWHSGHICVEIFFASTLPGGTQRFDASVWNQQCRICEAVTVPDLETDTYVERVVFKLQLYLGRREALIPTRDERKTKPHRRELCCACAAGVCKEE